MRKNFALIATITVLSDIKIAAKERLGIYDPSLALYREPRMMHSSTTQEYAIIFTSTQYAALSQTFTDAVTNCFSHLR